MAKRSTFCGVWIELSAAQFKIFAKESVASGLLFVFV